MELINKRKVIHIGHNIHEWNGRPCYWRKMKQVNSDEQKITLNNITTVATIFDKRGATFNTGGQEGYILYIALL